MENTSIVSTLRFTPSDSELEHIYSTITLRNEIKLAVIGEADRRFRTNQAGTGNERADVKWVNEYVYQYLGEGSVYAQGYSAFIDSIRSDYWMLRKHYKGNISNPKNKAQIEYNIINDMKLVDSGAIIYINGSITLPKYKLTISIPKEYQPSTKMAYINKVSIELNEDGTITVVIEAKSKAVFGRPAYKETYNITNYKKVVSQKQIDDNDFPIPF